MPIVLIPFAVFFVCCALSLVFIRRVRGALATRHPQIWSDLSVRAWSVDNAVVNFAWRRRDKGLNDRALTTATKRLHAVYLIALFAWLVFMACLVSGVGFMEYRAGEGLVRMDQVAAAEEPTGAQP